MRAEVREALDRLSYIIESEQGIKDLLLVQAELMSIEELNLEARLLIRDAKRELADARAILQEVSV